VQSNSAGKSRSGMLPTSLRTCFGSAWKHSPISDVYMILAESFTPYGSPSTTPYISVKSMCPRPWAPSALRVIRCGYTVAVPVSSNLSLP
jgi:hypothetical protein